MNDERVCKFYSGGRVVKFYKSSPVYKSKLRSQVEYELELVKVKKQGAVDFGFWLVNSPIKNKYSKSWIEIKYKQYLKEKEGVRNEWIIGRIWF